MKKNILLLLFTLALVNIYGQTFIKKGTIEYESRINVIKTLIREGDDNTWMEQFRDKLPPFSVNYYTCVFDNDKSIFKFEKNVDTKKVPQWFRLTDEDAVWYNNYKEGTFVNKKTIDDSYLISGNLKKINWKLSPSESMVIAGFNCRKASAVIFDSVYIFAYYTDEIAVSGGPMSTNGLPGMILGLTIPRLYTSWIATSVKLDADASQITPPAKGKKKNEEDIRQTLNEFSKSWGKDELKYFNSMIWRTFL